MSEIAIRNELGQWEKGNPYTFPAETSGRPLKYHPAKLRRTIAEYVDIQYIAEKSLTKAGLAAYMGITRGALSHYADGKIGRTPAIRSAIVNALEHYSTLIEAELEGRVDPKFRLTNMGVDRWRDTKHVQIDTVTHTAVVVLQPELVDKMHKAAGITVDGTCEVVVDK